MNKMFHVYSEGENVLFRENADYIFFNNKFASASYAMRLQILAETTMSTHFHSMAESADVSAIDDFAAKLRKAYAMYYSSKYGYRLKNAFRISKLEIQGIEAITNELLYIMKNPVHHYVAGFPFEYSYSSLPYVFLDKLMPPDFIKRLNVGVKKVGELTYRQKKRLVGYDEVPDDWLVSEGMILPNSYINIPRVRAFWNGNVKSFLVDINRNQTDAKKEIISADILDIRSSSLRDIDVCKIIDDYSQQAGRTSFHHLSPSEIQTITRILKQKAIPEEQIRRCLWL